MSATAIDRRPRLGFTRLATILALVAGTLVGAAPRAEAQTAMRTPTPVRTVTPSPTITATPMLERVSMAPLTAKRQVGQFQSFAVTAHFSDGTEKNFTQKVIYSSTDLNVVFPPNTTGNAGRVEAVGVGIATIYVTEPTTGVNSNTTNESAVMEVVVAPTPTPTRTGSTPTPTRSPTPTATATPRLVSLAISPVSAKRNAGQFQNFAVSGTFSDGSIKNMTQLVTYASSNSAVAATPNETGNKGKVLAIGPGVATISAAHAGGVSTSTTQHASFEVVIPPTPTATRTGATPTKTFTPSPTATATPVVASIVVGPATAKRSVGSFQNFTCTATMSDGSTRNFTQRCTYISSATAVAVAPNDTTVNKGRVNAVGIGFATISALDELSGVATTADGNAVFEVVAGPTPTPTSTGPTRTGSTPTPTRSPTPTVKATPSLVSLAISPVSAKRNAGQFQNFSVSGTFSDGTVKNMTQLVTYASSNSAVAETPNETGNKGKVLAVGPGTATISATHASGVSTSTTQHASFEVVIPPTPTATRTGATPTKTFTPSPTATATPVVVSIVVGPATAKRTVGSFQNFTCTATMSDGSGRNFTQRCTYISSATAVAVAPNDTTVNKGRVNAVGVGFATISALDELSGVATTVDGNAVFEVVEAPTPSPTLTGVTPTRTKTPSPTPTSTPVLLSLTLSPATAKRAAGSFQNFSVNGTYSNGDIKNLTQKVDYSSSNPAVAFPPNDTTPGANKGRVNAVGPGVATISAKDLVTGITTTASGGNATFTVSEAPTPTPTHTGPTSTAPTGTRTFTPSPSPTATPIMVALELKPPTAQKGVGAFQNFQATGTFSDGNKRNVTQLVTYISSDPTIADAPNLDGNRGRVNALKVGVVKISARHEDTGVTTTEDTSATLTIVQGNGTPNPRVTVTPAPVQVGNPTTVCQRDLRRAARGFVGKKLKALERCGNAASRCIQRKPDEPGCLEPVRRRCAQALTKVGEDEARLIATVLRRCAGLTNNDVLGQDGLAYGDLAASCATRFGRTLTDLPSVAQCLAAQHACRAEVLFALERPRAGELLRLLGASPDACREDFGGGGLGIGDPRGVGKQLERCVATIVKSGTAFAAARLGTVGKCIDEIFLCVEAAPNDATCPARATAKCDREFTKLQRTVAKLTLTTTKACQALDFNVLRNTAGGHFDAVISDCADYGIPSVTSLTDYVACLLRQHECEAADLLRYQSPRAPALLGQVGRALVDGTCPAP